MTKTSEAGSTMSSSSSNLQSAISNLQSLTRRHFFRDCAMGVGALALSELMGAPVRRTHHEPKAKAVIFLFMAGGPSQLELFDYKPLLVKHTGQPVPEEYVRGKRFAFMDTFAKKRPNMLGTRRKFKQHGAAGTWVSECLPCTAKI